MSTLDEKRFLVYLHRDSEGVIRYVGKGSNTYKRHQDTYYRSKKWWEVFPEANPVVEILSQGLTNKEALQLESQVIAENVDTVVNEIYSSSIIKILDFDTFDSALYYDETSPSFLRWKSDRTPSVKKDDVAGYLRQDGYWQVWLGKKYYRAHRVVWLLNHGSIADNLLIDHKDRNRANNAIDNLRLCDYFENRKNR